MRPGISPGNAGSRAAISGRCTTGGGGFNEAGGFLPRKRADAEGHRVLGCPSFNEAGGFLPRKPARRSPMLAMRTHSVRASMRPGDFSPGNVRCPSPRRHRSPRFNEAGGFLPRKPPRGRPRARTGLRCFNEAGGFLPRKHEAEVCDSAEVYGASMRPGDFSPGNRPPRCRQRARRRSRFNEAGGFLPRKLTLQRDLVEPYVNLLQ